MNYIKYFSVVFILAAILLGQSCSDEFLNQPSIGSYDAAALNNEESIDALLIGVYAQLNGTNSNFSGMLSAPWSGTMGSVRGGEALIGTEAGDGASWEPFPKLEILPTTNFIVAVFPFYYNAINLANQLITVVESSDLSDAKKTQVLAEVRFLRAHYYFLLKRLYGNIPWIDENDGLNVKVSNVDENGNYINIWPNIEADMRFAADNLSDTNSDYYRPNSWAAKAYLVKIRMEQKIYDSETYNLLKDVIDNGVTTKGEKYGLMPYYRDNFDPEQENNKEGVFMVAISVNAVTSGYNHLANFQNQWSSPYSNTSPGSSHGWGYFQPSQWFVDHFRVDEVTGLPYLDYYETNSESVVSDYGLSDVDPFTPETKPLDPRLDWVVGRRGIPYLDWGVMPGRSWMRDATGLYGGPYMQKKWMYYKAFEGIHNQRVYNAIDGPVIRFADVLLWAAELEVRVNNDLVAAKDFVNQVRGRMLDTDGWVLNETETDFAANYKIGLYTSFANAGEALDAILMERTLELGLEGHRFYDIIRFGDEYIDKELQGFFEFQGEQTSYLKGARFEKGVDEFVPFSQTAIINSQVNGVPTLVQNPGY
jgi:hypothetical protein